MTKVLGVSLYVQLFTYVNRDKRSFIHSIFSADVVKSGHFGGGYRRSEDQRSWKDKMDEMILESKHRKVKVTSNIR